LACRPSHLGDLVEQNGAAIGLLELARLLAWAPVKAPFSWPNSVASSMFSGMAAQLMATKGCSARGECR
jgi:hypothetical protein